MIHISEYKRRVFNPFVSKMQFCLVETGLCAFTVTNGYVYDTVTVLKRDAVVFYVGITNDMKKRLAQHKEPQVTVDIVMEMVKMKHDNRKTVTLELLEQQAINFHPTVDCMNLRT